MLHLLKDVIDWQTLVYFSTDFIYLYDVTFNKQTYQRARIYPQSGLMYLYQIDTPPVIYKLKLTADLYDNRDSGTLQ